jgi:hypothetical protein
MYVVQAIKACTTCMHYNYTFITNINHHNCKAQQSLARVAQAQQKFSTSGSTAATKATPPPQETPEDIVQLLEEEVGTMEDPSSKKLLEDLSVLESDETSFSSSPSSCEGFNE